MKNFPGNLRSGRGFVRAGAAVGLVALLAVPAAAQQYPSTATGDEPAPVQPGPVDLLATIQDNATADGNDDITFSLNNSATLQGITPPAPTISSIDEAVESVTELPVQMVPATSEPTPSAALVPGADTAPGTSATTPTTPSATMSVVEADNASRDGAADAVTSGDLAPETSVTITTTTAPASQGVSETVTLSETPAVSSVNLQKRATPAFGVAAIGVEGGSGLNATIWRDTPADRAAMLLASDMVLGASPSLSALAHDVVAQRAVPPVGGESMADDLVAARLEWLAAAGRSQTLEDIVNQLPNDPPWLGWKQWLVETQLMSRRDEDACRTVMYQVSRTFEPFWHKAKVICSAATGDVAGAQFAADILTAMGVDDAVFSALVAQLLNDTDPGPIDPSLLEPLHIVLMDAAHAPIDIDGLAALSDGSIETAVGLRYLDADARLVSTWRALDRGLVDHAKAAKLWRSAKSTPDAAKLALSRHQSQPSPLTRALVWRALANEKSVARLPMVAQALDADIASGAGLMMAPLYAELSREGLGFDGADAALAADPALATRMAMLMGVGAAGALPAQLDNDTSQAARGLLAMASGGGTEMTALGTLDLWHLLPLVTSNDPAVAEPSWLDLAMPAAAPVSYLSLSPPMLRALEQAGAEGRVAESVLLAHRLVGTLDLADIHPADAARIAAVLDQIGQPAAAAGFVGEVVTAHVLAAMQASGEVSPVELPAVMASDAGMTETGMTAIGTGQSETAVLQAGEVASGDVIAGETSPGGTTTDDPDDAGTAAATADSSAPATQTNVDTSN